MQRAWRFLLLSLMLLPAVFTAVGQNVEFTTNAPRMVAVGEPFRVEFVLTSRPQDFTPPSFEGFDVLAGPTPSQSQSVSVVNGNVTQSFTFIYTYVLQAREAGMLTIPEAKVKADSKSYSTRPTPIEVVDAEAIPQSGTQAPGASRRSGNGTGGTQGGGAASEPQQRSQASSAVAADDILVRVIVNRNKVYKGQPVRVVFKLYSRVNVAGIERYTYPSFNGFWAQDLNAEHYQWERETYNNKVYDTKIIRETLLYPQQTGTLYIEQTSMTVVAQVIGEMNRRNSLFDNIFGGMPQVQDVRRVITAAPVQITVEDLPLGAPASFNGAVGSFQMSGSLNETEMSANSSGAYQVKIAGNGNLPLIQAPKITLPTSFEQYNIKSTENLNHAPMGITGYRQFEYPFIPRAQGEYDVPPVEFSYFDPDKAQYVTLRTAPQTLRILADSTGGAGVDRGLISGISKEDLKILGQDIRFIKVGDPGLRRMNLVWFGSWSYFLVLFLLAAAAVGIYYYLRKYFREMRNTTLIRNKRANRIALQRLKAALNHMNAGEERQFYEEMLRALWGYMSDKLNIPVANLTKDNIREELMRRNIQPDQIEQFIKLISDCEYAQYSPSSSGHMNEIYNTAARSLSKFESSIKR